MKKLDDLIDVFAKLPGIGRKSAARIAFDVLDRSEADIDRMLEIIKDSHANIKHCEICGNLSENDICEICANEKRDKEVICVVEGVRDVIAFEKSETYNGLYHVLGGKIDPLNGVTIEDLNLRKLMNRLNEDVKEVILALNPNLEGETTSLYLTKFLKEKNIKISKIASGIPMGGNIEYTDMATLGRSLEGRLKKILNNVAYLFFLLLSSRIVIVFIVSNSFVVKFLLEKSRYIKNKLCKFKYI